MKTGPEKKKSIAFSGTGKHSDRAVKKWAHGETRAEAGAGEDLRSLDFSWANGQPLRPIAQTRAWLKGTFKVAPWNTLPRTDKLETGRASLEVGTEIAHLIDDTDD